MIFWSNQPAQLYKPSIDTLMDYIKTLIMKKHEIDNGDESKPIALFWIFRSIKILMQGSNFTNCYSNPPPPKTMMRLRPRLRDQTSANGEI